MSSSAGGTLHTVLTTAGLFLTIVVGYYSVQHLREMSREARASAAAAAEAKQKYISKSGKKNIPPLDQYEEIIMAEVVFPDEIEQSFADVGGMQQLKRTIYETVIMPLQKPELFKQLHEKNKLLAVPGGVLFYGPPGTGKTLIAKSIAKSSNCTFINVRNSTLQNKWFGESQKLTRAIFTLAHKLAPSIIFIDECDAFMKKRGGPVDHDAQLSMKSEFLTLCDGLLTSSKPGKSVTVLACTNRPFDVDEAFLRRMPRTFLFDLPSHSERVAILRVLLAAHTLESDCTLEKIAGMTESYTGSDLKEVCRIASSYPMRKWLKRHGDKDFEKLMSGGTIETEQSNSNGEAKEGDSQRNQEIEQFVARLAPVKLLCMTQAIEMGYSRDDIMRVMTKYETIEEAVDYLKTCKKTNSSAAELDAALLKITASTYPTSSSSSSSTSSADEFGSPRPIRLSDFKKAIRSIRPSGAELMERLRHFERAHRQTGTSLNQTDLTEDEDEDEEEADDDNDRTRRHSQHQANFEMRPHADEGGESDDEIYR